MSMNSLAHAAAPSMDQPAARQGTPDEPPAGGSTSSSAPSKSRNAQKGLWWRDLWVLLMLGLLVALAWQISTRELVRPQDNLGYWIGVAGATMMLLLFLYPLRKYVGWTRRLGTVKGWFWFHLVMGVAGPWLILVHSGFHTGSTNAAVALYSMAVVVSSGVIGRFLYVRLNSRIEDAEALVQTLRRRAGFGEEGAAPSALHYAPAVEARLKAFEARELGGEGELGRLRALRQVMLLPLQRRITLRLCLRDLRAPLQARAAEGRWSADEFARRQRRTVRLIDDLLEAIVRVARQQAFGRVFALWHHAHLPFIYLLVISTIVHVIAVHAY
jgi:hypothetical protein